MPAADTFGIVGTVIAEKYKVDRVVDEGGFSIVYKAEHLIWREPVALKCFKVLGGAAPEQRDILLDAFIQEGKLMTSLSSRSAAIVQARDIGKLTTKEGQWIPYIVMEWLDGRPLDIVLYEEGRRALVPRSLLETMALLEPAAVAFEMCHARGIAHRDIKPGNIIVMGDPRGPTPFVKVLDFGIAKVMADHAAQATAAAYTGKEITAFTPNYGAPEQFSRTHGATGPWTDVFAMALIVIEVMRGGAPALIGTDFLQLGMSSRDPQRRPTPRNLGVEVPDLVEAVFERALAVDPDHRFKTMGQFWTALHHAVFPDASTWSATAGLGGGRASIPAGPSSMAGGMMPPRGPSAPYAPGSVPNPPASFSGGRPPSMPMAPQSYQGAPQPMQGTPGQMMPVGQAGGPMMPGPSTGGGQMMQGPATGGGQMMQGAPPGYGPAGFAPTQRQTGSPQSFAPASAQPSSSARTAIFAVIALVAAVGGGFAAYRAFASGPAPDPTGTTGPATSGPAPSGSAVAPPKRLTDCPAGMVLVPGGKFFMGSDEPGFKLWQPAHKVTLDTFCIDITEVTAEAYKACSNKGECKRPNPIPDYPKADSTSEADHEKTKNALAEFCNFGKEGREKHPINCVNWDLANEYCKVNDKRLPTEAEWEYAARGSDGRKFPWGDDPARENHMNACGKECNAWEKAKGLKLSPKMYDIDDGYPGTAPVGTFPEGKTKFGAFDFVGNVWEWTADWFETYKPDEVVNPTGIAKGDKRAMRGGGFNGGVALWLNPAFRYHQVPEASTPALGFRCARSL